jgi:hypothetical protein
VAHAFPALLYSEIPSNFPTATVNPNGAIVAKKTTKTLLYKKGVNRRYKTGIKIKKTFDGLKFCSIEIVNAAALIEIKLFVLRKRNINTVNITPSGIPNASDKNRFNPNSIHKKNTRAKTATWSAKPNKISSSRIKKNMETANNRV